MKRYETSNIEYFEYNMELNGLIEAFQHIKGHLEINSFQELHLNFSMTNNNKVEFKQYKLGYGQLQ